MRLTSSSGGNRDQRRGGGTSNLRACGWLAILWVGILVGCRPKTPRLPERLPVRVQVVADATEGRGQRGAAYLATVKGRNQLSLSFKVPGIVERIGPGTAGAGDWREGTKVVRDQLLAQLKQADFLAASNSAAAQAHLDRTQFERADRLLKQGAASQQEYDRALAAKRASEALLELRGQDMLDSRIVAPFSGTILKREVSAEETVRAGQPVLTLADLSEVEIEVGVPDRLIGLLHAGSTVRLSLPSLTGAAGGGEGSLEVEGEVKEVGVAAREGSRLFRVVIRVPNSEGNIRPGMAASVYLDDAVKPASGTLVPLSALVARGERQLAVYVVTNGVARERAVGTSDILRSSIVVTNGLAVGEKVVVTGASQLYDGAEVEVLEGK